jgi:surface protein
MKTLTLFIALTTLPVTSIFSQTDFITTWNLANPGIVPTQLSFDVNTTGIATYSWVAMPSGFVGTGTFTGTNITITGLPLSNVITLSISPNNFNRININNGADKKRLTNLNQWGTTAWSTMQNAFTGCNYLNITATDVPNLTGVSNMSYMFASCSVLNGPSNIGTWNTAAVTDMSNMFQLAQAFNQPIGTWNTAAVTNMSRMFHSAQTFNQPIGTWNTAAVTNMNGMFVSAFNFNQPIGIWNTSAVADMNGMFADADNFNQPIGTWNTAAVTDMSSMFYGAGSFNQPIGTWNTVAVTNMGYMFAFTTAFNQPIGMWNTAAVTKMNTMFRYAHAFNQPIGTWNTAAVTDMHDMFESAQPFNQPIGTWNTAAVTNMSRMFSSDSAFNQPIGAWNTAAVTDMNYMFESTKAFNQPIGNWNTAAVINMSNMFYYASAFNQPIGTWTLAPTVNLSLILSGCAMDCNSYSATLTGWASNVYTPYGRNLSAHSLNYSSTASTARNTLLVTKSWTITGDNSVFTPTVTVSVNSGSICSGNSFTIVPSGSITYSYSSGSAVVSPTASTSYSVIGISAAGCLNSNTAVSSVTVNPILPITVLGTNSVCIGSSNSYTATGAATYTWSTGATTPSITVSSTVSASYNVIGVDALGCSRAGTVNLIIDNTCADVWPGDANSDGVADNLDVLELGLHIGQTGSNRFITSNLWQSYFANNWVGTLSGGKNVNHSDCNGDGTINQSDTLAIYNNYGLTHAFKPSGPTVVDPQLNISSDQSFVEKGKWGTASVYLGDAVNPINNVNGVAYTLNYDNSLIEADSVYLDYPISFINTSNQNLHFRKRNFASGVLYTATTHTTNTNVSGNGKIALVHFKIKSSLAVDAPLNFSISQGNSSNASGAIVPLTLGSASVLAVGASVGLSTYNNMNTVTIFPNPTNGILNIDVNLFNENMCVIVYNALGQPVLTDVFTTKSLKLNTSALTNGFYFIVVMSHNKTLTRSKFVKE